MLPRSVAAAVEHAVNAHLRDPRMCMLDTLHIVVDAMAHSVALGSCDPAYLKQLCSSLLGLPPDSIAVSGLTC